MLSRVFKLKNRTFTVDLVDGDGLIIITGYHKKRLRTYKMTINRESEYITTSPKSLYMVFTGLNSTTTEWPPLVEPIELVHHEGLLNMPIRAISDKPDDRIDIMIDTFQAKYRKVSDIVKSVDRDVSRHVEKIAALEEKITQFVAILEHGDLKPSKSKKK